MSLGINTNVKTMDDVRRALQQIDAHLGARRVHTHPASDIVSGQLVLERGGTESDLSATGSGAVVQATVGAALTVESQLALERGGTEADLSATGGAGKFLKQTSAGAAVTVGTIASSELPSHNHAASEITSGTLVHERGGLEADVSAYAGLIKILSGATSNIKCNFSATAAPAVTDDGPDGGYTVGSLWLDTTNDKAYICLDSTNDAAVWKEITVSSSASNVQIFNAGAGQTWTKPATGNTTRIFCIGSGGGGGSGRSGATSTERGAGGGGGGGGFSDTQISTASLSATETVNVGAGGAGGAAVVASNTDGNDGSDGNSTNFGNYCYATGGTKGAKGTTASGSGGTGGEGVVQVGLGSDGGAGNNNGTTQTFGRYGAAGGGGGGSVTSGNFENPGGNGGATGLDNIVSGGIAGGTGGAAHTNGNPGTASPTGAQYGATGGGGGGGGHGVTAGNGATGGFPGGGGGGGGGASNTKGGGAGGTGGDGVCIVVTW